MNETMSDNESPSTEVEPSQVNKSPVKYPASVTETVRPEQKSLHTHTNTALNKVGYFIEDQIGVELVYLCLNFHQL